jgi:glycerol kinase
VAEYLGAIDQGTTSTRFMVFDAEGREVTRAQLEHRQILTAPGCVEHDPLEILSHVQVVIGRGLQAAGLSGHDLTALGLTNQRETTVVWDPVTGRPWHNAIVWQDTRTAARVAALESERARLRDLTGLPPSTYFSSSKLHWLLERVDGLREAARRGRALFGTIDTWLIWNLTGGPEGGRHVTDVTNASRTQLMNLQTLQWDDELLELFDVPGPMLPEICPSSSSSAFGTARASSALRSDVRIMGSLGDQHAATVGQVCFRPGTAKNTYGTGNFLLLNTGGSRILSTAGLLTTVAYQLADDDPAFALEGSVAVTGAAVQWLRDQMGLIASAAEIEPLAASVPDTAGACFVPAFSGLFAPHWRADARGALLGLSRFHTRAHIARATLEAICFQTREVLDAMAADSGARLAVLKVDGGATVNDLLMQMQADILGVPVVRPVVSETTALGAAYAAGLAAGVWRDADALCDNWKIDRQWEPQWTADQRESAYARWRKAVERSVGWIDVTPE